MYYLANQIWLWTMLVEKCRKKLRYHVKRELPKTQELLMYKCCHNELCYAFLMKHCIVNLYNHMHFFRYLDVLQSTVMFHFNI